MAGYLTSSTAKGSFQLNFSKALTGYAQSIAFAVNAAFSLSPATTVANNAYVGTLSLASSATVDINLLTDLDPFGAALAATKMVGIILIPTGTNAIVKLEPGAANGLVEPFGAVGDFIKTRADGVFVHMDSAGWTVDGTHKVLTFTNTGAGALVCQVVILVKAP